MVSTRSTKKYNSEVTQVRDFGKTVETTLRISRFNEKKQIDVDELHGILTNITKSLTPDTKVMIRVMNIQRMFTIKSFADDDLNIDDFDEYYKNSVEDLDKFKKFSSVFITTLATKPKEKVKRNRDRPKKIKFNDRGRAPGTKDIFK